MNVWQLIANPGRKLLEDHLAVALFVQHHTDREIGGHLNHDHKTVKKHLKPFETFMPAGGWPSETPPRKRIPGTEWLARHFILYC
jgi:hypothetical protein